MEWALLYKSFCPEGYIKLLGVFFLALGNVFFFFLYKNLIFYVFRRSFVIFIFLVCFFDIFCVFAEGGGGGWGVYIVLLCCYFFGVKSMLFFLKY